MDDEEIKELKEAIRKETMHLAALHRRLQASEAKLKALEEKLTAATVSYLDRILVP